MFNIGTFKNYFTDIAWYLGDSKYSYHYDLMKNINFNNEQSALYSYLHGENKQRDWDEDFIFPFDLNESQINAVKQAFHNQISVIEGPPGTGKTQTVLNIIANAVYSNNTVAVVSPTNAATENVYEKLGNKELEFIAANLGNSKKNEEFFNSDLSIPDKIDSWKLDRERSYLIKKYKEDYRHLEKLLSSVNRQAKLKQELREWEQEKKYYAQYFYSETNSLSEHSKITHIPFFKSKPKDTLNLLADIHIDRNSHFNFFKKSKYFFSYGIFNFEAFSTKEYMQEMIDRLEYNYYAKIIESIKKEINKIDEQLKNSDYEELRRSVKETSMSLFKASLRKKYENNKNRRYTLQGFKKNKNAFLYDFPVILSTNDSIIRCINRGKCFDYVIIDEASMSDLAKSIFPLSVANNFIIVGDSQQLPPIINLESAKLEQSLPEVPPAYNYFEHSILSSVQKIYGDRLPSTLLREHYRCHPMIINFCNKTFYNNELVIMTESKQEKKPLAIVKTSVGNHMATNHDKKVFNQREIDSYLGDDFKQEIPDILNMNNIGFVTPYREQANRTDETLKVVNDRKTIANTVHKFQGRECDAVIFSTVLDDKGKQQQFEFVEKNELLNVAVSRAKDLFILNSSVDNFSQRNSSIAELIRYIRYYSEYSLEHQSKVRSIFDLLTKGFESSLIDRRNKFRINHSRYDSENLMMDLIIEVLESPAYKHITYGTEYRIKHLITKNTGITDVEREYVNQGASLDFVFYYKQGKDPIAAIEVDGFVYHFSRDQQEKDKKKNEILKKVGIPLKRFSTKGSQEKLEIKKFLEQILDQY